MSDPIEIIEEDGSKKPLVCKSCGAPMMSDPVGILTLITSMLPALLNPEEEVSEDDVLCLNCRAYEKGREASESPKGK